MGSGKLDASKATPFKHLQLAINSGLDDEGIIKFDSQKRMKLRANLKTLRKNNRYVDESIIKNLVGSLDPELDICCRLDAPLFVTVLEVLLQAPNDLTKERGLYILQDSLGDNDEMFAESVLEKKLLVCNELLLILLGHSSDDQLEYTIRRWVGILVVHIFTPSNKNPDELESNIRHLEAAPEDVRRRLGTAVSNERHSIMQMICGQIIRSLLSAQVEIKTLWPENTRSAIYEAFPTVGESSQGTTQAWSSSFKTWVGGVWKELGRDDWWDDWFHVFGAVTVPGFLLLDDVTINVVVSGGLMLYATSSTEHSFNVCLDIQQESFTEVKIEDCRMKLEGNSQVPASWKDVVISLNKDMGNQYFNGEVIQLEEVRLTLCSKNSYNDLSAALGDLIMDRRSRAINYATSIATATPGRAQTGAPPPLEPSPASRRSHELHGSLLDEQSPSFNDTFAQTERTSNVIEPNAMGGIFRDDNKDEIYDMSDDGLLEEKENVLPPAMSKPKVTTAKNQGGMKSSDLYESSPNHLPHHPSMKSNSQNRDQHLQSDYGQVNNQPQVEGDNTIHHKCQRNTQILPEQRRQIGISSETLDQLIDDAIQIPEADNHIDRVAHSGYPSQMKHQRQDDNRSQKHGNQAQGVEPEAQPLSCDVKVDDKPIQLVSRMGLNNELNGADVSPHAEVESFPVTQHTGLDQGVIKNKGTTVAVKARSRNRKSNLPTGTTKNTNSEKNIESRRKFPEPPHQSREQTNVLGDLPAAAVAPISANNIVPVADLQPSVTSSIPAREDKSRKQHKQLKAKKALGTPVAEDRDVQNSPVPRRMQLLSEASSELKPRGRPAGVVMASIARTSKKITYGSKSKAMSKPNLLLPTKEIRTQPKATRKNDEEALEDKKLLPQGKKGTNKFLGASGKTKISGQVPPTKVRGSVKTAQAKKSETVAPRRRPQRAAAIKATEKMIGQDDDISEALDLIMVDRQNKAKQADIPGGSLRLSSRNSPKQALRRLPVDDSILSDTVRDVPDMNYSDYERYDQDSEQVELLPDHPTIITLPLSLMEQEKTKVGDYAKTMIKVGDIDATYSNGKGSAHLADTLSSLLSTVQEFDDLSKPKDCTDGVLGADIVNYHSPQLPTVIVDSVKESPIQTLSAEDMAMSEPPTVVVVQVHQATAVRTSATTNIVSNDINELAQLQDSEQVHYSNSQGSSRMKSEGFVDTKKEVSEQATSRPLINQKRKHTEETASEVEPIQQSIQPTTASQNFSVVANPEPRPKEPVGTPPRSKRSRTEAANVQKQSNRSSIGSTQNSQQAKKSAGLLNDVLKSGELLVDDKLACKTPLVSFGKNGPRNQGGSDNKSAPIQPPGYHESKILQGEKKRRLGNVDASGHSNTPREVKKARNEVQPDNARQAHTYDQNMDEERGHDINSPHRGVRSLHRRISSQTPRVTAKGSPIARVACPPISKDKLQEVKTSLISDRPPTRRGPVNNEKPLHNFGPSLAHAVAARTLFRRDHEPVKLPASGTALPNYPGNTRSIKKGYLPQMKELDGHTERLGTSNIATAALPSPDLFGKDPEAQKGSHFSTRLENSRMQPKKEKESAARGDRFSFADVDKTLVNSVFDLQYHGELSGDDSDSTNSNQSEDVHTGPSYYIPKPQSAIDEWSGALRPYQKLGGQLCDVYLDLTRHLQSAEVGISGILESYESNSILLVKDLEHDHAENVKQVHSDLNARLRKTARDCKERNKSAAAFLKEMDKSSISTTIAKWSKEQDELSALVQSRGRNMSEKCV